MIKSDILEQLKQITPEEQDIICGERKINRDIYMLGRDNTVNSKKLLDEGKLITMRKHTRFIAFPEHTHDYVEVEDILNIARAKDEDPFIILLDGITDPHNLGAILRTAECAGAHGVIIPKRRSVGLNATVGKTSAGAIEFCAGTGPNPKKATIAAITVAKKALIFSKNSIISFWHFALSVV